MALIVSGLAGLLGAAAGLGVGLVLGGILASAFSISSFEGAAGYFTVLIAIACGLIGFVAATALALRYQGHRGLGAIMWRTGAIVAVLGALAAAAMIYRLATVEHFSGASPQMQFEIRLPVQAETPERRRTDIEMQAGSQRSGALLRDEWLRQDGDRTVIRGFVPLYTRTSQRILVVSLPNTPKLLFNIRLAATPKPAKEYGAWQRVNLLDDGKADSQPRKPHAVEDYEIRYFVAE